MRSCVSHSSGSGHTKTSGTRELPRSAKDMAHGEPGLRAKTSNSEIIKQQI